MCAPTGTRKPLGSPDPSEFTYSKLFRFSGEMPPGGRSVSGERESGTPLRHRPQSLAASSSGSISLLVRLQEFLEADDVRPDHLEHGKAAIAAQFGRLGHEVILSLVE